MQRLIYRNRKGFSLIELIVVMAVMAILVLLAAPRFLGYTKDAKVSAMQADTKVLSNAALQYNIKTEAWPVGTTEATVELTSDLGEAIIDALNITDGEADGLADELADLNIYEFDPIAEVDGIEFSSLVKNTKEPMDTYYLITAGEFAGEVFYLTTLQDSTGNWHNGVYEVVAPVE